MILPGALRPNDEENESTKVLWRFLRNYNDAEPIGPSRSFCLSVAASSWRFTAKNEAQDNGISNASSSARFC